MCGVRVGTGWSVGGVLRFHRYPVQWDRGSAVAAKARGRSRTVRQACFAPPLAIARCCPRYYEAWQCLVKTQLHGDSTSKVRGISRVGCSVRRTTKGIADSQGSDGLKVVRCCSRPRAVLGWSSRGRWKWNVCRAMFADVMRCSVMFCHVP